MPLKTLFLNPPSFENFDGGASSRWPATREIESYWYPVWLAYPAGMLEGSRLLDAPPHHVSALETIEIAKGYEFLVLFTSTVGWHGDHGLAEAVKKANPSIRIAFVGPPVTTDPDRALNECPVIDFVCRREFDFSVVEYANGKPLPEILGISYKDASGVVQHNPRSPSGRESRRHALGHQGLREEHGTSPSTTSPSSCILSSRFIPPVAVPRSAPSASGPRPCPAMPGASDPPTTSLPRWPGPSRTSPR